MWSFKRVIHRFASSYDELDGGEAADALGFDELRGELLGQVGMVAGAVDLNDLKNAMN
jgi:hypothetical protein